MVVIYRAQEKQLDKKALGGVGIGTVEHWDGYLQVVKSVCVCQCECVCSVYVVCMYVPLVCMCGSVLYMCMRSCALVYVHETECVYTIVDLLHPPTAGTVAANSRTGEQVSPVLPAP